MEPRAGRDVGRYLRGLAGRLDKLAVPTVAGEPDAAHQLRTTARRASACLRVFGPAIGVTDDADLRGELRWLTTVVGTFRDAEVMAARLRAGSQPSPQVDRALSAALDRTAADLRAAVTSPRFGLLPRSLAATGAATRAATGRPPRRRDLRRAVRKEWRRAARRHATYRTAANERERDEALHALRRSLRRLRYACDALGTSCGSRVVRVAAAAKKAQEVLGEHHDAVVSLGLLSGLAATEGGAAWASAHAPMFDLETRARDRARVAFDAQWPRLEALFES